MVAVSNPGQNAFPFRLPWGVTAAHVAHEESLKSSHVAVGRERSETTAQEGTHDHRRVRGEGSATSRRGNSAGLPQDEKKQAMNDTCCCTRQLLLLSLSVRGRLLF